MKRQVVSVRNIPYTGSRGSNILTLECGHITGRKGSAPVPQTVFCKRCDDWRNGRIGYSRQGNVIETWDADRQLPVFTQEQDHER